MIVALFSLFHLALACKDVTLFSEVLGNRHFTVLPASQLQLPTLTQGRPAFISNDGGPVLYLYHTLATPASSGVGRWVVNDELGSDHSAAAFIDSWAVTPYLIHAVNDPAKLNWLVNGANGWEATDSLYVGCTNDDDATVFLSVEGFAWHFAGFYTAVSPPPESSYHGPLYTFVGLESSVAPLYLFKLGSDKWLIGSTPGEDGGHAYVEDSAPTAAQITNTQWRYASNNEWRFVETAVLSSSAERNVYGAMRDFRSIKYIPADQYYFQLRSGVPMPALGLGTGNIPVERVGSVVETAMRLGYRMFDTAREYGNENVLGSLLAASQENPEMPLRSEIFVISKVWPTEFGFVPTLSEVLASLQQLQSSYVDLYMLHWPSCNPNLDWMHCETAVDASATWREAYRAMERAYAEGRVMSIGVSNFNDELLWEAVEISTVTPQAVQNFASPGEVDMPVRQWCAEHDAVYIPYATVRNIPFLPEGIRETLENASMKHNVSPFAVSNRFFLQSGAAIIPRATHIEHLRENLETGKWELEESEMIALGWPGN